MAAAALEFKMRLLRVALGRAATEAAAGGGWLRPHGGWAALQTVLAELTRLWARLRQEAAAREQEAGQLFVQRAKESNSGVYADDTESAEAAAKLALPNDDSAFEEFKLAPDDSEGPEGDEKSKADEEEKAAAAVAAAAVDDSAEGKVRRLLEGPLLEEVVCLHTRMLLALSAHTPLPSPPTAFYAEQHEGNTTTADSGAAELGELRGVDEWGKGWAAADAARAVELVAGHTLGGAVARWLEGVLPVSVDAVTGAGHVLRVALEHRRANRAPLQLPAAVPGRKAGKAAEAAAAAAAAKAKAKAARRQQEAATALDLNAPGGHAGEMALLQEPVTAAKLRLAELLDEWPEHPILSQLHMIASRLLTLPLFSPLKQALTGLELLLARAQVGEASPNLNPTLALNPNRDPIPNPTLASPLTYITPTLGRRCGRSRRRSTCRWRRTWSAARRWPRAGDARRCARGRGCSTPSRRATPPSRIARGSPCTRCWLAWTSTRARSVRSRRMRVRMQPCRWSGRRRTPWRRRVWGHRRHWRRRRPRRYRRWRRACKS